MNYHVSENTIIFSFVSYVKFRRCTSIICEYIFRSSTSARVGGSRASRPHIGDVASLDELPAIVRNTTEDARNDFGAGGSRSASSTKRSHSFAVAICTATPVTFRSK